MHNAVCKPGMHQGCPWARFRAVRQGLRGLSLSVTLRPRGLSLSVTILLTFFINSMPQVYGAEVEDGMEIVGLPAFMSEATMKSVEKQACIHTTGVHLSYVMF